MNNQFAPIPKDSSDLTLDKIQEAIDLENGVVAPTKGLHIEVLAAKEQLGTEPSQEVIDNLKKTLTEAEQAFVFLAKSNSEFRSIVTNLRKKGSAGRVLESILFSPFVETPLLGKDEENLLEFCKSILYYRDVAMRDVIEKNPDKFKGEINESNTTK